MKIERTSIYNIYGITSKEKQLVFNALHEFRKGFGEGDQAYTDLTQLMERFKPTDEAPLMNREQESAAINAALF